MFKASQRKTLIVRIDNEDMIPHGLFVRGMTRAEADDCADAERQRLNHFRSIVDARIRQALGNDLRWSLEGTHDHFIFRCGFYSDALYKRVQSAVTFIMRDTHDLCRQMDFASHLRRVDY